MFDLVIHNATHAQGAVHHHQRHDAEAHGQLVAHHLAGRADGTQQRILVVTGPATEHDAVNTNGNHCEYIQNADI